ncbi:MAG TPA: cytochrome c [Bryobacteraceae bacterium]|nr:cytochrome c [Bryobacteraceae bacterium]
MAISPKIRIAGGLAALLLGACGWAETAASPLESGKKVFVARCSNCHAERGDKPLGTGLPLSDQTLTDDQLNRAVAGRLKTSSAEEKRAVASYIRSFQKK